MEDKGYLTDTGRVVQTVRRSTDPGQARDGVKWSADAAGEPIVATLGYKETRYNLRRVLVSREWMATCTTQAGTSLYGRQFTGATRAEVVSQVLDAIRKLEDGAP